MIQNMLGLERINKRQYVSFNRNENDNYVRTIEHVIRFGC